MATCRAALSIIFLAILLLQSWCTSFTPVDNYLIDCGSSSNTTIGSRIFVADTSLYSTLTTSADISGSTNNVPFSNSSVLYQSARIFTSSSAYSFKINPNSRLFVRLYFFSFVYELYDLSSATFTVSTQDVVLLDNFQPQVNSTIFKEFLLNITSDDLILSFVPIGNTSLAFVNALEVVSVPDDLILDTAQTVSPTGNYRGLSKQTLETVYRLNMGGPQIVSADDTLWRTWEADPQYLLNINLTTSVSYSSQLQFLQGGATEESAPDAVYNTARRLANSNTINALFNMTWQFNVDGNSSYFLRLHFCDIVSTSLNELYFDIYIGGKLAVSDFDLSTLTVNTLAAPYFMDFVINTGEATKILSISIGPSRLANVQRDGILNGLEIMKININNATTLVTPQSTNKKKLGIILGSVIGAVFVTVVAIGLYLWWRRQELPSNSFSSRSWLPFLNDGSKSSGGTGYSPMQEGSLSYCFTFSSLQEATKDFDENLVIGVGGFGKVYKGELRNKTTVAVKRGNRGSQQGLNEFQNEIELLSRLRHRHLVSLIGYCDENNEMILVYEYMEKGSLKKHLYGSNLPPLSWKQRLEICIGSARGLHYLHTSHAKAIIHRDVKSANILLDENLLAKVADFGLSKLGPEFDQTHVSTVVKGSYGYLDPEYYRRQQLSEKSDVYSFGVVLLEVLCARPVIDPKLPQDMVNLADWGMKCQKDGELEKIVDSSIAGTIRPESLKIYGDTVEKCLQDYGVDRPSMGDVLWNLEYVLKLQETNSTASGIINSFNSTAELPWQVRNFNSVVSVSVMEVDKTSTGDFSDASVSKVFSQLITSQGR